MRTAEAPPSRSRSLVASLAALGLLAVALVGCTDGEQSTTGDSVERADASITRAFDTLVADELGAAGTPGWVVLAWTPDLDLVSVEGEAALDPDAAMHEDARFQIRSITKSFTVTLVLQLVDAGELSLDDPIGEHVAGVPGGDEITLAQLAAMRSGLPDYATDAFVDMLVAEPDHVYEPQDLLDFAFAEPVSFPPGAGYEYSNTNTVLLGMVVEQVTGEPLADRYAEGLWGPLGLDASAYPVDGPIPDPHVLGYDVDPETLEVDPALAVSLSALGAAGGMVSVASDLRTWGDALVDGTLLEPETQAERFDAAGPTDGGPEYDAYGLGIGEIDGWWGHTGEGLGFATAVLRDPDRDAGLVILLNGAAEHDQPAALARLLIPTLEAASD